MSSTFFNQSKSAYTYNFFITYSFFVAIALFSSTRKAEALFVMPHTGFTTTMPGHCRAPPGGEMEVAV